MTLEVIRFQTPSLQTSSTVGVKSRRALFGQFGNSKLRFRVLYSDDLSETGLIDDDSLRLNAMQGHGLEDADMPASQWRLGGKCKTF